MKLNPFIFSRKSSGMSDLFSGYSRITEFDAVLYFIPIHTLWAISAKNINVRSFWLQKKKSVIWVSFFFNRYLSGKLLFSRVKLQCNFIHKYFIIILPWLKMESFCSCFFLNKLDFTRLLYRYFMFLNMIPIKICNRLKIIFKFKLSLYMRKVHPL